MGSFFRGSAGQLYPLQDPFKQIPGLDPIKPLGRRCAIGAFDHIIVYRGQGGQFPMTESMQAVMSEGQLPIAPLHTRAGALKELSAFFGHLLDAFSFGLLYTLKGAIPHPERGEQFFRVVPEKMPLLRLGHFTGYLGQVDPWNELLIDGFFHLGGQA